MEGSSWVKARVRLCIICGDTYEDGNDAGNSSVELFSDFNKNPTLEKHISVMMLVRKILKIPHDVLELLLRDSGDPAMWGIALCKPCYRVFKEAEFVHNRILQLSDEFESLATILRGQLHESERRTSDNKHKLPEQDRIEFTGEASSSMHFVESRPRRGRGRPRGRGRRRKIGLVGRRPVKRFPSTAGPPSNNERIEASSRIRMEFSKLNKSESQSVENDMENRQSTHRHSSTKLEVVLTKKEPTEKVNADLDAGNEILDQHHDEDVDNYDCMDRDDVIDNEGESMIFMQDSTEGQVELQDDELWNLVSNAGADTDPISEQNEDTQLSEGDGTMESDQISDTKSNSNADPKPRLDPLDPDQVKQPIKQDKDYKCPLCARTSAFKCSMIGHILRSHYGDRKPFHCHLCEETFGQETRLRDHLKRIHKDKRTPLDENDDVEWAKREEHEDTLGRFECDMCPKTKYKVLYKNEDTLDAHKKMVHLGIKRPYECKLCSKTFKLASILSQHMTFHQKQQKLGAKQPKERAFCKECNRNFKNMACLKAHLRTKMHGTVTTQFQCEYCEKAFMSMKALGDHHAHMHYEQLNIQPHICKYCARNFAGERALKNHIRVRHMKQAPHQCTQCSVGYMHKPLLDRHVAIVHGKVKEFQCSECPKMFSRQINLDIHLRTHTGEKPFKCKECGKEYADPPTFKRHLETHGDTIHQCSVCGKEFKVWHSYRLHMRKHNQIVWKHPEIVVPPTEPAAGSSDFTVNPVQDQDTQVQNPSSADLPGGSLLTLN